MPLLFGVPFSKLLTVVVIGVIIWQMFELWRLGRKLTRGHDPGVLTHHRGTVACIGCLTVLAIGLIELQVRTSPDPYVVSPWLFVFHLSVDAMFVAIGAIIVLRFTGLRSPRWHGRLAYSAFALFFLSLATGTWMLYRLPA